MQVTVLLTMLFLALAAVVPNVAAQVSKCRQLSPDFGRLVPNLCFRMLVSHRLRSSALLTCRSDLQYVSLPLKSNTSRRLRWDLNAFSGGKSIRFRKEGKAC
jgi:hypothetical protein